METIDVIVIYTVLGFGLRGGYPYWNEFVRALYAIAFPFHELFFRTWNSGVVQSLCMSYWKILLFIAVFVACAALAEFGRL